MTQFLKVGDTTPNGSPLAETAIGISLSEGSLSVKQGMVRYVIANAKAQDVYAFANRGGRALKNKTFYWKLTEDAPVTPTSGSATSDESGRMTISLTPEQRSFPPADLPPARIQFYRDESKSQPLGEPIEFGVLPPVEFALTASKEGFVFDPMEAKTFDDGTFQANGTFTLKYSDGELTDEFSVNQVLVVPKTWAPGVRSGTDGNFVLTALHLDKAYRKYGLSPKAWTVPIPKFDLSDEAKKAIPDYRERIRYSLENHWHPIGLPGASIESQLSGYDRVYLRQLCAQDKARKAIAGTYLLGATVGQSNVWNMAYNKLKDRTWQDFTNMQATVVGYSINFLSTKGYGIADALAAASGKLASMLSAVGAGSWQVGAKILEKIVHYSGRAVNALAGFAARFSPSVGPWASWCASTASSCFAEFSKIQYSALQLLRGSVTAVGDFAVSLGAFLAGLAFTFVRALLLAIGHVIAPIVRGVGRLVQDVIARTPLASFLEKEGRAAWKVREVFMKEMGEDCGLFNSISKYFDVYANLVSNIMLRYFWNATANPGSYSNQDPSLWAGFLKNTLMTYSITSWMQSNCHETTDLRCPSDHPRVIGAVTDSGLSMWNWTGLYTSFAGVYDTIADVLDKLVLFGEMALFALVTLSGMGIALVGLGPAVTAFEMTFGKWKLFVKDLPLMGFDILLLGGTLAHHAWNMDYLVSE